MRTFHYFGPAVLAEVETMLDASRTSDETADAILSANVGITDGLLLTDDQIVYLRDAMQTDAERVAENSPQLGRAFEVAAHGILLPSEMTQRMLGKERALSKIRRVRKGALAPHEQEHISTLMGEWDRRGYDEPLVG